MCIEDSLINPPMRLTHRRDYYIDWNTYRELEPDVGHMIEENHTTTSDRRGGT